MEGRSLNIVAFSATSGPVSISERGGVRVGGSQGERGQITKSLYVDICLFC